MWRKAFHAVICWLALSQTSGELLKTVNSSIVKLVKDNASADSAPRLYRNVPLGVYASAAPYAAYSFHLPTFMTAPKAAASRIVPVINNADGYLRDSYGNRFVENAQSAAYKTAFPQQFLPLQELPAHLVQPLVAASSQAKQPSPHYFVGSQYRVPTYQVAPHSLAHSFPGFSQPLVYAQNLRSLAPSSALPTQTITAQQQPSSNKAVFANTQGGLDVKFQRLEQQPVVNGDVRPVTNSAQHSSSPQLHEAQAAPATVTAIVNGKKTVVNIDTKPPVPLLDLSLLEPLTFANPLVPQVQHFLPKINEATCHKLPEFNVNDVKKQKKEKTKSHDGGVTKGKSKKKPKQPTVYLDDDTHHQNPLPVKPTIKVSGTPNESPEFSYEFNSPNYKETYKEKKVSYNKAADGEPLTYTYDEKTQSEPITYSYTKSEQKEPVSYNIVHTSEGGAAPINQVTIRTNGPVPKQLIYSFKPEHQNRGQNDHQPHPEDGSAEDTSDEADDDRPQHRQGHSHPGNHPHPPSHNSQSHHSQSHLQAQSPYPHNHHHPQHHTSGENHDGPSYNHYDHSPKEEYHQSYHPHQNEELRHRPNDKTPHRSSATHHDKGNHRQNEHAHHRHEEIHRPNSDVHYKPHEQVHHKPSYVPQHHRSQEIRVPVQQIPTQYPVTQEFEENIRIAPSAAPATISNGNQGEKEEQSHLNPLASLQEYQKFVEQQMRLQLSTTQPQQKDAAPVIHEQAKRIIIQEESPDEMHTHQEQNIMAEMIEDDGNDEEDFENAYKNAAYGFEAFDGKSDRDREKDIYNPASYGFSREQDDGFNIEKSPFQQYQAEGDRFPKSSRAQYKDARDSNMEDYYLDYSVHKPSSLTDLYKNKANYYKLFKKQKPEKYYSDDHDKRKEKKSEKYVAPTFDFGPKPEKKEKNYFAQYKAEPVKYEYKFTKDSPHDNSAHASRPFQRYRSKTHFVEPQFQYGFEPIAVPRLLDSELAAMASNHSPESEKPGTRKKIYKENWYIKKTSTSGGKPS